MTKIYEQSKDLHVVSTVIYAHSGKAYADADHTIQLKTSELKEAFVKGAMVQVSANSLAYPVMYTESSGIGTIQYIKPNGTTATSADIAALVAKADD